jgi:hypothetical protein
MELQDRFLFFFAEIRPFVFDEIIMKDNIHEKLDILILRNQLHYFKSFVEGFAKPDYSVKCNL